MLRPILFNADMVRAILEGRKTVTRRVVKFKHGQNPHWTGYIPDGPVLYGSRNVPAAKAPYRTGDILYVRETWNYNNFGWHYRADWPDGCPDMDGDDRWYPSLHMPKDAARIFLRVKSVTVERLRDMVLGDVLNEGVQEADTYEETWDRWHKLWDSTVPKHPNKFKSYPFYWKDNPWVWVIKFERISKEQAMEATQNAGV